MVCPYMVYGGGLYLKYFLDRFDRLDTVRKAGQRVQGHRRVALDDGTHGV